MTRFAGMVRQAHHESEKSLILSLPKEEAVEPDWRG
jgi:hypothetical protein